jgi:transposase
VRRGAAKARFLREARAWNERAQQVRCPSLARSRFFDPRDKVQVKYEMLRAHHVDGVSVAESSRQFGYSRESFYAAAEAFAARGVLGLVDQKRGPRSPRKLISEVRTLLIEQIEQDPEVASADLAQRVKQQLGVAIHRRTVERFRSAVHAAATPAPRATHSAKP